MLCKHQVIGSIPIGSTNPQFARRISEANSHANKDGQRCKSSATRRGFAATDGARRWEGKSDPLTQYIQMMKTKDPPETAVRRALFVQGDLGERFETPDIDIIILYNLAEIIIIRT